MKAKDGKVLTVMLIGDEHVSYYVDVVTGKKMQANPEGLLENMSDETLRLTAEHARKRRAAIEQRRYGRLMSRCKVQETTQNGMRRVVGHFNELNGEKKGLVILVNFADKEMTYSREDFNEQFNQQGYSKNNHIGSVRDYFYDQSYGQFTVDFDVVGPYILSKESAYYGENGYTADSTVLHDVHVCEMVTEACQAAYQDGTDFSKYDWDNDGEVDQVYFIYAGKGESSHGGADTIWPHHYTLTEWLSEEGYGDGALHIGGMTIDSYACSNELQPDDSLDGIGTVCHEFSHCLGFPDLYDIDYSGGLGMLNWDVMAGGADNGPEHRGEVPCGYSAYERWQVGWLQPVVLKEATEVKGMKPLIDSPNAYVIYNDGNENEFMMLENRTDDRWFKIYGFGFDYDNICGLLVTHVDYDAEVWKANGPNDDPDHQRVALVPASGTYNRWYNDHLFNNIGKADALTPDSHVNVGGVWYAAGSNGSKTLNFSIKYICLADDKTLSFCFVPKNTPSAVKTAVNTLSTNDAMYNLMGQRLKTGRKGIVIVNNRKMMVR